MKDTEFIEKALANLRLGEKLYPKAVDRLITLARTGAAVQPIIEAYSEETKWRKIVGAWVDEQSEKGNLVSNARAPDWGTYAKAADKRDNLMQDFFLAQVKP